MDYRDLHTVTQFTGIPDALAKLAAAGTFCGVGVCTGADVIIPVLVDPTWPGGPRTHLGVTVKCCVYCAPALSEAFPLAYIDTSLPMELVAALAADHPQQPQ